MRKRGVGEGLGARSSSMPAPRSGETTPCRLTGLTLHTGLYPHTVRVHLVKFEGYVASKKKIKKPNLHHIRP